MKKLYLIFSVYLLLFFNSSLFCQPNELLAKFLAENASPLYYVGTISYYSVLLFSEIYNNNDWEDQYSEIIFVMPLGSTNVICLQNTEEELVDIFTFTYDEASTYDEMRTPFKMVDENIDIVLKSHRNGVLEEVAKTKYRLMNFEVLRIALRYW